MGSRRSYHSPKRKRTRRPIGRQRRRITHLEWSFSWLLIDGDPAWLRLGTLWQRDSQHAVFHLGCDLLQIRRLRQGEGASEAAMAPLKHMIILGVLLLFGV